MSDSSRSVVDEVELLLDNARLRDELEPMSTKLYREQPLTGCR